MSKKNRLGIIVVACLLLLGTGVYASSSIVLNSGNSVNLGAGSQRVTTCDNDVFVNPPGITFDPVQQKYLVTTISVSNVSQLSPSGCGNWIMELAVGYQGGYQMTSWSIPSAAIDSTFYFGGTNTGTGMAKTSLNAIDPNLIQNIAIQMYPGVSCADGGPCAIGDLGPGGGPVVYIAATPFTDPVTGNRYKYIEAAPAYWIAGTIDPNTSPCGTLAFATTLSSNIGYARSNTNALLADGSCTGTSTSASTVPNGSLRAAALVRSYGSDWNLPTFNELNEICKIARFGAAAAASKATCDAAGGSAPASGYLSNKYVASSKGSMAGQIDTLDFGSGARNTSSDSNSAPINLSYRVRPIRYFG